MNGDVDLSMVFTHTLLLSEVKQRYELFKHKQNNCIKVVLKP